MRWTHMSNWDQEEYALGQRTPEMIQHLRQCAACRAGVEQLEKGTALFRESALAWSTHCVESGSQTAPGRSPGEAGLTAVVNARRMPALQWAVAAMLFLLVLLPLTLRLLHKVEHGRTLPVARVAPQPAVPPGDDALLQQVDEQISEAVPQPMESLTHLVKTSHEITARNRTGAQYVERN